jgi:hypothetical protein
MLKQGQGIVPDNRSTPAVAMVQMFENIRQQAHEYRFDAGTIVVQPYQQFSLMGLAGLEGVQKLALRLGILGAFLGLLFAIRIIPTTLNDMANLRLRVEQHSQTRANASRPAEQVADPDSLRQLDQKQWNLFIGMGSQVFEALSIKFGSSIAGLYVAVGVSLFASALRRRLRLYFQDMEDAAIHFTLLASRAENKTSLRLDFERLREEMQRMRETVHDKSVDLLGQIRTISAHLEVQIQKIEEGMTRLATARGTLEGFLCALDQKQNRFLDDISRSYQAASLSHELMEIRSALSSDQQALSRDVTERIGKLRSELIELHNAMAGRPASLLPEPPAKMALGGGGAMLPMDYAPPASLAPPGFLGRIKRWFSST